MEDLLPNVAKELARTVQQSPKEVASDFELMRSEPLSSTHIELLVKQTTMSTPVSY